MIYLVSTSPENLEKQGKNHKRRNVTDHIVRYLFLPFDCFISTAKEQE